MSTPDFLSSKVWRYVARVEEESASVLLMDDDHVAIWSSSFGHFAYHFPGPGPDIRRRFCSSVRNLTLALYLLGDADEKRDGMARALEVFLAKAIVPEIEAEIDEESRQ
jgi:hypothetical protein